MLNIRLSNRFESLLDLLAAQAASRSAMCSCR